MFFELIGTIVAGIAAALIFWALNRALGGRLPSWLVPVSAGAAMLLATISSEYSWFSRTVATLPEGLEVAQSVEETALYRPWTYAKPFVSRFVAVDRASLRSHPDHPGQRIVDLVLYGRWAKTAKVPMLFDCAQGRRADIADGVEFSADGAAQGVTWRAVPTGDPVQAAVCKGV